jgi:F420-non-reducing hydrogenase iron-sulfur subunit
MADQALARVEEESSSDENPHKAFEESGAAEKPREIPADWTPNILAFACHYCAFAAADLAGVMRLSYPENVKVIRMPCTGKLDHIYVLRAFERGADGVFVAG